MGIVDLTHTISPTMPVFPGTEQPVFQPGNTKDKEGFDEKKITMFTHTGTHIDAPYHMQEDGKTIDQLAINCFFGTGVLVDLTSISSDIINIDDLRTAEDLLKDSDFLIIRTGWSQYWGSPKYFRDFPVLSTEAAQWLLQFKLKGIGIDAISLDHIESQTFINHHIVFKAGMVIIENLTNLDNITAPSFLFSCLPLKIIDGDGSPIRAAAILSDD